MLNSLFPLILLQTEGRSCPAHSISHFDIVGNPAPVGDLGSRVAIGYICLKFICMSDCRRTGVLVGFLSTQSRIFWEEGTSFSKNASVTLVYGQVCEVSSQLMIDRGGPSPLWVATSLGRCIGLYKRKMAIHEPMSKSASSVPP